MIGPLFYWVKQTKESIWEIAERIPEEGTWFLVADQTPYQRKYFARIRGPLVNPNIEEFYDANK